MIAISELELLKKLFPEETNNMIEHAEEKGELKKELKKEEKKKNLVWLKI